MHRFPMSAWIVRGGLAAALLLLVVTNASATSRRCTNTCNECFSAWSCKGKLVGQSCGKNATCKALKTCTATACCGCARGSEIYLDDNERVAEADLPIAELSDSPPATSVRFFLDVEGEGEIECGDCTTASGCREIWVEPSETAACVAVAKDGHRFVYWSRDGEFLSTEARVEFATKGAVLQAHFVPSASKAEWTGPRPSQLRAVVFRVYGSDGSPLTGATVLIKARSVELHPKLARGDTVNGLRQTYVPCSAPSWPTQIFYEWEIWSAAGKPAQGYWWQSSGWICDQTKNITVRLQPIQ